MTVGERIRKRRIELGYTQEQLAKKMGYSGKTSVCKAETYENDVTTAKVSKFAKALDCSEAYLMGWETIDGKEFMEIPEFEPDQLELIEMYSKLNKEQKLQVLALLRSFTS